MSRSITAIAPLLLVTCAANALPVALSTSNGLQVIFSDTDGSIAAVAVGGVTAPRVASEPGGLAVEVGIPIALCDLVHIDFNTDGGPWTSARNADWDSATSYTTWVPGEGRESAHLLLGDGLTEGAGMAMASACPVAGGSTVRISWLARSAAVNTTMILCTRVYDSTGNDITAATAAPAGWTWSDTSQAHVVFGMRCDAPDTWQQFDELYTVAPDAASIRVSLRHWTGGDHFVHLDDLNLDVVGGLTWSERVPVLASPAITSDGLQLDADMAPLNLHVAAEVSARDDSIAIDVAVLDTTSPQTDRPMRLYWTLPVDATGWTWWDDIDSLRAADTAVLANTFDIAGHDVSYYPFATVTTDGFAVALGVPMDQPAAQHLEYDPDHGLQSVWDLAPSPLTVKMGAGQVHVSLNVYTHDPAWGMRAAADVYCSIYPYLFTKRTTREGAWMYPILPSQIPDPSDFGFAFLETHPIDETERAVCAQNDIGVFYYLEPWLAWQPIGDDSEKPPYDQRVATLESWAEGADSYTTWLPDGGVADTAHLLLGDGNNIGAGMATSDAFAVTPADTLTISWQARTADLDTTQILGVRLFDAAGNDITQATPAPAGWFFSSTSMAHVVPGIANSTPAAWEPFSCTYELPPTAASIRVSLRHWNDGDHLVHIDDLHVEGAASSYLDMSFETDDGSWLAAQDANWDDAGPLWLRTPRDDAAAAVLAASPLNVEGRYLIDASTYYWHEWSPDEWNQAWPLNPDPDLAAPSAFDLYRQHWILDRIAETDGIYIDSVAATGPVGGWENHRPEHLSAADYPLTWSIANGAAVQLGPQSHAEFLQPIAREIRDQGRLMMLNLFPDAMRFHAHDADIMGSEIFELIEPDVDSRLRRTLARRRIVSNLLQWGWDSPTYATYEQMESFIRGQLFWGFYPAVSSAGGMLTGGIPDRYFLHPELYERDRPLFQLYMPVIRELSSAGWEPVTWATASPLADIERYGDFTRGPVLLTVRGVGHTSLAARITLNLEGAGLHNRLILNDARDLLVDQPIDFDVQTAPLRAEFSVSLDAGEVGVYRFAAARFADFDSDGQLTPNDQIHFNDCLAGPTFAFGPESACCIADADYDADVDLADASRLQQTWSAP